MKLRTGLRAGDAAPISLFAFQDIIFAATGIFLFISIMMTLFGKVDMIASESLDETAELREELNLIAERTLEATRKLKSLHQGVGAASGIENAHTAQDEINPWLYDTRQLEEANMQLRAASEISFQNLIQSIMEMNRSEHRLELLQSGAFLQLNDSGQAILRDGKAHDFREVIFLLIDGLSLDICYPGRPDLRQRFDSVEDLLIHIANDFSPRTQSMLLYLRPSGVHHFYKVRKGLRALDFLIGYEPVREDFDLL